MMLNSSLNYSSEGWSIDHEKEFLLMVCNKRLERCMSVMERAFVMSNFMQSYKKGLAVRYYSFEQFDPKIQKVLTAEEVAAINGWIDELWREGLAGVIEVQYGGVH